MKKTFLLGMMCLFGMLATTFTSCNKDDNNDGDSPAEPSKEEQTITQKHFKSATAIYNVTSENCSPYFDIKVTYMDKDGKIATHNLTDSEPLNLTFPATLDTKIALKVEATAKSTADKSSKPYCGIKIDYGFDIVDAITGQTTKVGQDANGSWGVYENSFDEVLAAINDWYSTPGVFTFVFDEEKSYWHWEQATL